MAENAPYEEEAQIEDTVEEAMFGLLLLALLESTDKIILSRFTSQDFATIQDSFRDKTSEVYPKLSDAAQKAIDAGVKRTVAQTSLKNLSVDHSARVIQDHINAVLSSNMRQVLETNQRSFRRILEIADQKGWPEQEIARRLKRYYGLIPSHIDTVVNMENALLAEGTSKKTVQKQVQTKIDQLIEWRMKLVAATVATDIVEGSKAVAFSYLFDEGQIGPDYVKQWVSVIDSRTSDICLSSNRMTAEINSPFPNGFQYPPAHGNCRSSIRLIKRPS